MERKEKKENSIGSIVRSKEFALSITFISLVITIVFAIRQSNILNRNTLVLERVDKGISTTPILDFPNNIPQIIKFIKEEFNEHAGKKNSITLEIYTDFIGYGVASDNTRFHEYLETLIELKGQQDITWFYYNEEDRDIQNKAQFAAYKDSVNGTKMIEDYAKKCMSNIHTRKNCKRGCLFDTRGCELPKVNRVNQTCFLIREFEKNLKETRDENKHDLLLGLSKSLQEAAIKLADNELIISDSLNSTFPFFAWFILAKNDKNEIVPQSAVITFPAYGEKATEKGFKTNNSDLVHVLYETMLDKTGQESKKDNLKKR